MSAKPMVAATDGSEESLRAVDWAAREAVLRGAPLRIVSAAAELSGMMGRHDGPHVETVTDVLAENRDQALATAAARAAKVSPDLLVDTDRLPGAPAEAVAESGSGALMLVVGSRGVGAFRALILGSVSRYAATHAPCPVVVVRDEATAAPAGSRRHQGPGQQRRRAVLRVRGGHLAPGQPARRARLEHSADVSTRGPGRPSRPPAGTRSPGSSPASSRRCSTTGGPSTPTSRSARTSSTVTRAGRWPACPRAPTWSSSAGAPARTAPAPSPTRS